MRRFNLLAVAAVVVAAFAGTEARANGCGFTNAATADADLYHNGSKIYSKRVVGCYNQQVGKNAACTTAEQHVLENANAQTVINTLKSRGACGNVSVLLAVRLGTRNKVDCKNVSFNTGGTWIAAVPASCPSGFSMVGSRCVQIKPAVATCPKDYWLENHKTPFQCVKQACAQGSMPGVAAWAAIGGPANGGKYLTDDKGGSRFFINPSLSCKGLDGFNLEGDKCVKTAAVIPAVAAYCKR